MNNCIYLFVFVVLYFVFFTDSELFTQKKPNKSKSIRLNKII